jgi:hypothetical protein
MTLSEKKLCSVGRKWVYIFNRRKANKLISVKAEILVEGETPMKRLLVFATVVVTAVVASGLLLAQSNPFVGTWKLNPAKSKYTAGAPPKEETVTIQMVGEQDQVTATGTAADGSPISVKYETPDKGGAGKILAGPYDAVSAKRIDAHTNELSFMEGGKEIRHIRAIVSKDGKALRITQKGTDLQGKSASGVVVLEKQ